MISSSANPEEGQKCSQGTIPCKIINPLTGGRSTIQRLSKDACKQAQRKAQFEA